VAGPSDHPTRPAVRLDVMGLLLLVQGGEVIALTGTALRSGGPAEQSSDFPGPLQATSFCRRPLMSEVCMTLIPYDRRKGIPLNVAAEPRANRRARSATDVSSTASVAGLVAVNGSSAGSRWP
jgi:hypothetical protein